MKKVILNTLIVSDDDLECKNDKTTLTDLNLNSLSFNLDDINQFNLIIYKGVKGTKVLKSDYFRTGRVVN